MRKGIIQSNQSSFSTLYRLADLVVITAIYFYVLFANGLAVNAASLVVLFVCIISFMLCAESSDIYRSWRTSPSLMMIKSVLAVWLLTVCATVVFAYFLHWLVPYKTFVLSYWLVAAGFCLLGWRIVFREVLYIQRKKGHNSRNAVIIGATASGYSLAEQISDNEYLGINFKGFYDDRCDERIPHEMRYSIKGNVDDVIQLAKENKVDYIYLSMPMSAEKRIMSILNLCSDTTATVYIIPNFFIYNLIHARWQNIGSIQTLSVFDTPFQGGSDVLKRIEDIVLSSLILSVIALPMLLIAAAVKITSPGPAIFKQTRYGLDGKPITIYKFRSMSTQDNGKQVKQAQKNDPRITRLGAFIRRTSLDELPQFINVLQGRMSIVGPRPHAVAHNEEYRKLIEGYMLRHKVRPGITGWAQINGYRGETETINKMVKRVEYDLDYIHRWSVWLDIKIIFSTAFKGFVSKNAY
ncbi:undecaprenyl-phosphate glucose phosphotransferase [Neptunicella marina]|uniref:Undecaprenyl-phosphate glucose phosphotransferase n=2 Tax=Neptunicella marina TaxID=2125989 RepID=A0A8J6IX25_9ALTE|nr:undecaprenyl-phosphate glucose phosphotransferase [Neptunicella marina]